MWGYDLKRMLLHRWPSAQGNPLDLFALEQTYFRGFFYEGDPFKLSLEGNDFRISGYLRTIYLGF